MPDVTVATPASPAAAPSQAGRSLDAIFRPRSIAVIGASRDLTTVGGAIFHNLLEHGFQGPVYPINPKASNVQSVRAYASLDELPEAPELAIIVVPAVHVLPVLEACGKRGVKGAVVISAGFKEIGPDGAVRERDLVACARRYGMRLVGPNCLGVLNTEDGVRMDGTFAPPYPPPGRVAFSSQSGALGLAILDTARALGIGISHFISVGNKADVSGNDLLEYWEQDPGTDVVLLYLESFGNPRRFLEIARRVGRKKPIAAVKSGRTGAGMRAASSHTGSLAGADSAVSAMCAQAGVIRTDTIEELFDVAMLIANQPVPRGNRVGIVTNAGGPGILASDACEYRGMVVPTLDDATVAALRAFLPAEASTRNPVDMIASATPASFEKAVRLIGADPNVDSLLVLYVPPIVTNPDEVAQSIVHGYEAAKQEWTAKGIAPKPILSCFLGSHGVPEALAESHVPSYMFPESAAIALSRAVRYGEWLARPDGATRTFTDVDAARARRAIAAGLARAEAGDGAGTKASWLSPEEVREVLSAYRVALPETAVAATADEAAAIAKRVGFPVAIKLVSERITHKTDVGGVVLDVRDEDEVREAFDAIHWRLREKGLADDMDGVSVQPMIRDGIETIVGVTRDPSFGPLLLFGLGGVQVELLKDVVLRVAPLTDLDARAMIHGIKGAKLLAGYRGAPPGDLVALEEALLRVSQLVMDHPEIAEMDLNPLKVREPGKGALALDARIAVKGV